MKKGFGLIDVVMLTVVFMFMVVMLSEVIAPTISQYYSSLSSDFPNAAEFLKLVPLMFVFAFISYIFVRAIGSGGGGGE